MTPVFGQNPPPLEKTWAREASCGTGSHIVDAGLWRCTECGVFVDDMCIIRGCAARGYDGFCREHEAATRPEARA